MVLPILGVDEEERERKERGEPWTGDLRTMSENYERVTIMVI